MQCAFGIFQACVGQHCEVQIVRFKFHPLSCNPDASLVCFVDAQAMMHCTSSIIRLQLVEASLLVGQQYLAARTALRDVF